MGEIEEIYEKFEPREKMMYHIVDGEFRGWIYKDLGYGVELTSENGYFEIEDNLYNKLEQERIEKNGVIVGHNGELKVIVYPKEFITPIYDDSLNIIYEGASLEEQIKYYENRVIEKTKELENLRLAGFEGTIKFFNLEIEIVELRKKYLNANHELALEIDNKLKGV